MMSFHEAAVLMWAIAVASRVSYCTQLTQRYKVGRDCEYGVFALTETSFSKAKDPDCVLRICYLCTLRSYCLHSTSLYVSPSSEPWWRSISLLYIPEQQIWKKNIPQNIYWRLQPSVCCNGYCTCTRRMWVSTHSVATKSLSILCDDVIG